MPGLREQMKDGHTEYINTAPTVIRLKDYLMDIFFAREDENNRDVVAVTGTLGSVAWHDALAAVAASFFTMDTNYIRRTTSDYAQNALSFGAQFTHYSGPNGVDVRLTVNPMYDSSRFCKLNHPIYTEYPIDSARLTFCDFGSSGESQNIMCLKVKDTFRHGYLGGTVSPMGPAKGGAVSVLKAGYDVFAEGTCGIVVIDPTRTGRQSSNSDED